MIGNDIVDLRDPDARPQALHPRFDERAFHPVEQQALQRSGARARLRWILWAAKEAAYKVAVKLESGLVFAPRRFCVELDPMLAGVVHHGEATLPVLVWEDADVVHAVASDHSLPATSWHAAVAPLRGSPADAARALARERLAPLLGARRDEIEIVREGRIPSVRCRGVRAPVDLSLSHHGRHVAFACQLLAPEVRA